MIEPFLAGDAFLADVFAARGEPEALHLWWLGQSGFLIQFRGRHMLLDPYLSDALTKKYESTDKPHVRMTARVVDPARLDFIDVVTASHAHTDHLDAETLQALVRVNPRMRLLAPVAIRTEAAKRSGLSGARLVGIDDGAAVQIEHFVFAGMPAAHNRVEYDAAGHCRFMGLIVSAGPFDIYHSGDTVFFPEMVPRLRRFSLDVALLPINGDRPERRVAGNLDGVEAARLAKNVGARLAVPCHYEMFEFNTAAPSTFEEECRKLKQPFRTLRAGERLSVLEIKDEGRA